MRFETRLTTYQVWESPQDHDLEVSVNIIEKEVVQHNIVLCCLNFENLSIINTVKSWFYFKLAYSRWNKVSNFLNSFP